METVFTQIIVILLYVLIGIVAGKADIINPSQRKYLTKLCTDLILPFTILSASSQTVDGSEARSLAMALCIIFVVFAGTTIISLIVLRVKGESKSVQATVTSLLTYSNCTFLGLPLCRALFGEMAVLYNAMAIIAFNVLFFTIQTTMFTGGKFNIRSLLTVPNLSTLMLIILLLLGIHPYAPLQTVISSTGAMITPLSLIIIGVMMSENDIIAVLREKRAYAVTLIRNLLIPLISMCLLLPLPMSGQVKLCVLVYIACPCATLTTIYAIRNDMEPELAARSVLMSTIFFAVSLPLVILAGQAAFL